MSLLDALNLMPELRSAQSWWDCFWLSLSVLMIMHWKHHHWADPGRGTGRSCAFVRPARMPPQSWLYFDKRNIQAAPHRVVAPLKVSVWPGNSFCSLNCDMRVLDSTVKSWFLRQQEPSEITCLSVYFMAKQARTKRNDFVEALWHFFPKREKKLGGNLWTRVGDFNLENVHA